MKNFEELTREELYALTDKEIERYKKIVLAENGIVFPKKPKEPVKDIDSPDKKVFCIDGLSSEWGDLCFTSAEDASAFVDMLKGFKTIGYRRYESGVDYNTHYFQPGLPRDYYDNVPTMTITVQKVYSKEVYDAVKKNIKEYNKKRDEYDRSMNEYRKAKANAAEATSFIDEKISEAREDIGRKKRYTRMLVNDYLPIAEGNIDIAMKFLDKAYNLSDDDKDYVLAHKDETEE